MIGSFEELCDHKIGRRVLLYLLNPRCSLHFTPQFISLLTPGDGNQHRCEWVWSVGVIIVCLCSKKPADVRWAELREAVSGPLIELAILRATQWSRSKPHAPLLIQIASSATGILALYSSLPLSLCVCSLSQLSLPLSLSPPSLSLSLSSLPPSLSPFLPLSRSLSSLSPFLPLSLPPSLR